MVRLFSLVLVAISVLGGLAGRACERHLDGHQTSTGTSLGNETSR